MRRAESKNKKMKAMVSDCRSGQAMLIAVLSLGGAILGATTVAGLLTLYQLRAANDSQNSAKAIFAADSGVEWTLFDYYCGTINPSRCAGGAPDGGTIVPSADSLPSFTGGSGATISVACTDINGNPSVCSDVSTTVSAITIGTSGSSKRAFAVQLVGATSTDP
jgi:hypothetical protein